MNRLTLAALTLAAGAACSLAQTQQSPAVPDAVVDLRDDASAAIVNATWRSLDARIVGITHHAPGPDLKPSGPLVSTFTIEPRPSTPDFDTAPWTSLLPSQLEQRHTNGRLAFHWYRLGLTLPDRFDALDTAGTAVVLELTADDYAEIWVNGTLAPVLGHDTAPLISGWNAPARVLLTPNAQPGQRFDIAIFASNGPLSEPPPNFVWLRSATLDIYAPGAGPAVTTNTAPTPVDTTLLRLDDALDQLIAPGTRAERLATGFVFTEGPVWVPRLAPNSTINYGGGGPGGYLLFSDPNQNVIHRYDPHTHAVSIYRTKSGYSGLHGAPIGDYFQPGSNGLALDHHGRLTICEHGNRRISRLEPNGSLTVLADRYHTKRLNSPNDLVYRADGALFFTDPPFGLPAVFNDPRKELPTSGVFALINGSLRLVADELTGPNGLAFTPDHTQLYVANWDTSRKVVLRYDVAPDGSASSPTTFADLTTLPGDLCLDGLKVDQRGNVYLAAPDGVRIYAPTGTHLGTLQLPELPANFAFGDDDGQTLYLTARTGLYRIRTLVPGATTAQR